MAANEDVQKVDGLATAAGACCRLRAYQIAGARIVHGTYTASVPSTSTPGAVTA
jgi:hypothetical protein